MRTSGERSLILAILALASPVNMPQAAAAGSDPPKPTLSAPEPSIASARNETLSRLNGLIAQAARDEANPSVAKAIQIMKKQQLDWPTPAAPSAPGLAQRLADAMKLNGPIEKFLPQLAAFNDALGSTPSARRQGALELLKAAGQPMPKEDDLNKMIDDAQDVHDAAAPDSQHGVMNAGNDKIDIQSSPSTGQTQVSVYQTGADGKPERVTINGRDKSVPAPSGNDIQREFETEPPQIVSSKQSDDMRAKANGNWTDQDGHIWEVAGAGNTISFAEIRPGGHRVTYLGTWKMGLPYASHLVNDVNDMDNSLPDDVRQQLADTYHPPFTVQLTFVPDKLTFTGVWTSGEVTYSGMMHTVKVVKDPTWDKPLILTKKSVVAYYSGADPSEQP